MNAGRAVEQTDLSLLNCPAEVTGKIGADRQVFILRHGIDVRLYWWNARIGDFGLPGGPISAKRRGEVVIAGEVGLIERRDVFALAEAACESDEGALRLLWHALAWGSGNKLRLNRQRLRSVAADVGGISQGLRHAAQLSREDPERALAILCPARRPNLVRYMGPSFATKYLYFAGGGRAEHPCLILDDLVAATLRIRCGWASLGSLNWPPSTYGRYCSLVHRWSAELFSDGRVICADQLERAMFELAR